MTVIYRDLIAGEARTRQVITDVTAGLAQGRNCLVLTIWIAHLHRLAFGLRAVGHAKDAKTANLVDYAIYTLSVAGPALGRPLDDTVTNSKIANLKELRPGSRGRSEVRILFVFDPWRSAILLVADDKAGSWNRWYTRMIPHAEQLYEIY